MGPFFPLFLRLLSLELHETACGNRRVSNPSSFTSGTLRADCTTSRRGALSVVVLFGVYVPPRLSSRSGCAPDSPESLRVESLSTVSRLFDRVVRVTVEPSVVNHACAAVAVAHGRRVHERRETLPRAARGTCCACWGLLCAVVLAGPDLHGLAGFPLVPDLKCFRSSLEWLSSKLAVRRCLLNPVLPLPMPSAPP